MGPRKSLMCWGNFKTFISIFYVHVKSQKRFNTAVSYVLSKRSLVLDKMVSLLIFMYVVIYKLYGSYKSNTSIEFDS